MIAVDSLGAVIQVSKIKYAIWNNNGKPSNPNPGEFGFNIDLGNLEIFDGNNWVNI
jgi:hypothetical protein